jgi:hypothetical protein
MRRKDDSAIDRHEYVSLHVKMIREFTEQGCSKRAGRSDQSEVSHGGGAVGIGSAFQKKSESRPKGPEGEEQQSADKRYFLNNRQFSTQCCRTRR